MRKFLWRGSLAVITVASVAAGMLAWNIHTYHRLTDEALIARLRFIQLGPHHYQAELRSGDFCRASLFELYGDQWRIDARFLKWKPWANLLGMDARYRLERLSGRYQQIEAENSQRHLAHDIGQRPLIDLARYAQQGWGRWMPVDTLYGSSVYEAMLPGYEYTVHRSQTGLLVRRKKVAPARYEHGRLVIEIAKDCVE